MTYRVDISRDETRLSGGVTIEVTAYIDRVPEPNGGGYARLIRLPAGVWNSRMFFSGDFASLAEAVAAIEAAHPDTTEIRCYEWPFDYEDKLEMPPLQKTAEGWRPGPHRGGPPPWLDWQMG